MERELRVMRAVYVCDMCERGTMEFTGVISVRLGEEIRYEHKCDYCGHTDDAAVQYPETRYVL